MDRVDSLIAQAERLLENAPALMAREGSVADARLLAVIALLLDAVKELATRNDPLAAEKAEAAEAQADMERTAHVLFSGEYRLD